MKSPLPTSRLVVLSLVALAVGTAASLALAVPSLLSVQATGTADAGAANPATQDVQIQEPRHGHYDDDYAGGG